MRRASSNRRGDLNLLWTRYELQAKLHVDGNHRFSLDTLELIMRRGLTASAELPLDPLVKMAAMRLAFEHHKSGKLESAASVLRTFVQATDARGSPDYDASNLLAECWAALERWHDMFEFLCSLKNQRCARQPPRLTPRPSRICRSRVRLPSELLLHLALCEVHLGRSSKRIR